MTRDLYYKPIYGHPNYEKRQANVYCLLNFSVNERIKL